MNFLCSTDASNALISQRESISATLLAEMQRLNFICFSIKPSQCKIDNELGTPSSFERREVVLISLGHFICSSYMLKTFEIP